VVEGKYWGRNLDVYTKKEDRRETEKQTSSPEMQVVRYLRDTQISISAFLSCVVSSFSCSRSEFSSACTE
jgi:hypothetical protein